MSEKPVSSNGSQRTKVCSRWVTFILPLCAVVPIVVGIYSMGGPMVINWGGLSVVEPIRVAHAYQDNGQLLYQTWQAGPVIAGIDGVIVFQPASKSSLSILGGSGDVIRIQYTGLKSVTVRDGQVVNRQDIIGTVDPRALPDHFGGIRMRLVLNGVAVPPPTEIPKVGSNPPL